MIMFWNEDIVKEIDTNIILPVNGSAVFYDGWKNKVFLPEQNQNTIRVRLAPGENIIVCVGEQQENCRNHSV